MAEWHKLLSLPVAPGGGKAVVITTADPAIRERAKARNATLPMADVCPLKHVSFRLMCRVGSKTRPETGSLFEQSFRDRLVCDCWAWKAPAMGAGYQPPGGLWWT